MRKLNNRKIRWIIREKEKGELTNEKIAQTQHITPRRVRQLWREYRRTGSLPILKRPGRPRKPITDEEMIMVMDAYREYKAGAVLLEAIIMKRHGMSIPHNRIHRILKENGISRDEPKKKRRRKWVRYERSHSMELWHTDWKWIGELDKWIIAYEDDASRYITSYGLYDGRSTEAAIETLERGTSLYGIPDAVLTDRGSEFYSSEGERRRKGKCEFEIHLRERGIRHIVGRVNHPQTNGKIERFYLTLEQKLPLFEGVNDLILWYNTRRPHMSLNWRELETPLQAFYNRLSPERIMGFMDTWFWEVSG